MASPSGRLSTAGDVPSFVEAQRALLKLTSGEGRAKLGALLGVYLPCLQCVIGMMIFLRFTWIVGTTGVGHGVLLILLCCSCTFFTCLSISALATNGLLQSGGPCFVVTRNVGAPLGTAVGLLFYLGYASALALVTTGAVEVFLLYMAPGWTIGGAAVHAQTGSTSALTNNFRVYSSILLVTIFIVNVVGVKVTQRCGLVALSCVLVSLLCIVVGVQLKHWGAAPGPSVCLLGDRLVRRSVYAPDDASDLCALCNGSADTPLRRAYCSSAANASVQPCAPSFYASALSCVDGMPGFTFERLAINWPPVYLAEGEAAPTVRANKSLEVFADIDTSFFVIASIFFPSVTGILSGVAMSGDLTDPQLAIPRGTIAAQLTGTLANFLLLLVVGGSVRGQLLRDKYGYGVGGAMVIARLAWPSPTAVLVGAFAASIGCALQAMCGAPRLLLAVSGESGLRLLRPFSRRLGLTGEPFFGQLLTLAIAGLVLLIGRVDLIAPLVIQFILFFYIAVNLANATNALLDTPNWRPRFRCAYPLFSLIGALECVCLMIAGSWPYAVATAVFVVGCSAAVAYCGADVDDLGDLRYRLRVSLAQALLVPCPPVSRRPLGRLLVVTDESVPLQPLEALLEWAVEHSSMAPVWLQFCANVERPTFELTKGDIWHRVVSRSFIGELAAVVRLTRLYFGACDVAVISIATTSADASALYWAMSRSLCRAQCPLMVHSGRWAPASPVEAVDLWWVLADGDLLLALAASLLSARRRSLLRIFVVARFASNSARLAAAAALSAFCQRRLRRCCSVRVELADVVQAPVNSLHTYQRCRVTREARQRLAPMQSVLDRHVGHYGSQIGEPAAELQSFGAFLTDCMKLRSSERLVVVNVPSLPPYSAAAERHDNFVQALVYQLPRVLVVCAH